jgi:CDP-diglyceride synthetase
MRAVRTFAAQRGDTQIIAVGALAYLVCSFLNWQQVSAGALGSAGLTEWHGVGVLAVVVVIALMVWEVLRAVELEPRAVDERVVSLALALALTLLTIVTFLDHRIDRHWPAWLGLALSILIGGAALWRGQAEGVRIVP